MADTRRCRACAEEIRAAARICPHCRQSQRLLSARSPLVALPLSLLLVLAVAWGVPTWLAAPEEPLFAPGEGFEAHADEIVVRDTSFAFDDCTECEGALQVTTVGMLENTGDLDWENLRFEVRYLDAAGELVDTVSSQEYAMVLRAGGETAFRVKAAAARPRGDYAEHAVFVKDAVDMGAWP